MTEPRTSPRLLTRPLPQRNSVHQLQRRQLSRLRQAFGAVLEIEDDRGYYYHAGIHGLPLGRGQSKYYCRHHDLLFLPWHRAYLYLFERALRDQVPDVMLPWWDWSSSFSHTYGIPEAYAEQRIDGEANPLYSVPIPDAAEPEQIPTLMDVPEGWDNETFRRPSPLALLPTADTVREIRTTAPDFQDFSVRIEDVHDHMHGWVGGTMNEVEWAAYDPSSGRTTR